jgi:hypothetical protein
MVSLTFAWRCKGVAATKQIIVEQFGLAMSAPFLFLNLMWDIASRFTYHSEIEDYIQSNDVREGEM